MTHRSTRWLIVCAVLLIVADQLTKALTHWYLPAIGPGYLEYPYGGIPVFSNVLGIQLSIRHVVNYGAAWGTFSNFQPALLVVRIFLIIGMLYYVVKRNPHPTWRAPLMLVIAGATSNVIDTFSYGHVVDMIQFTFWGYDYAVFNLADSAVCLGVAWWGWLIAFHGESDVRCDRRN